jgi:predicted small integral membrane protein
MTIIGIIMLFLGLAYIILDFLDAPGFNGVKSIGFMLAILGLILTLLVFFVIR